MADQPVLLMSPTMRIKPERLGEYLVAMRRHRADMLASPNTLRFDVGQDIDDPTLIRTIEIYASAEQLEAEARRPDAQAYLTDFLGWLAEPVELTHYDATVRKHFFVQPGSDPTKVTG